MKTKNYGVVYYASKYPDVKFPFYPDYDEEEFMKRWKTKTLTMKEWNSLGYMVKKGEKSKLKGCNDDFLFEHSQVRVVDNSGPISHMDDFLGTSYLYQD